MKYLIMTDLEGVVGVDRFAQTRTDDERAKRAGMKQLARETNACVAGIHDADFEAEVTVLDGHGSGGLFADDLIGCTYMRYRQFEHDMFSEYAAFFFVGQHAMEGTFHAPLCHTFSSLAVQYYRLNGVNIGEFSAYAQWAGLNNVPTVFLSGDDKAVAEARMFIPELETVVTKVGTGLESAVHGDSAQVCQEIRHAAAQAVRRKQDIPVFVGFEAPYRFEARYYRPIQQHKMLGHKKVQQIDERTYCMVTDNYRELPFF